MKILLLYSGRLVFMAAFENRTIKEIRDLLLDAFQEKFNITFRLLAKSFLWVFCTVIAGLFITLYKLAEWVVLQLFPDTAYWGEVNILGERIRPLVKWGVLMGVGEPKSGTQWKGRAEVTVIKQGGFLFAGTQLKSTLNGKLYIIEESVPLENDTEEVSLISVETGSSVNLDINDILTFVSPLGVIEKNAVITEIIEYALENEQEKEYRSRVSQRFRAPPMGGALSDYRAWANEVSGVWNSYPQKDETTPAGVLIWVAGKPDLFPHRIPDEELLRRVGKSCTYDPVTGIANRKPIAAIIDPQKNETYANISPISVISFGVKVYGLAGIEPDDFYEPCKIMLDDYFMSREPYIRGLSDDNNRTDVVSRNSILSVVNQVAVSLKGEFSNVELIANNEPIRNYNLVIGQLAELETLNVFAEGDPGIEGALEE
jgi:uncharacterized phage protein gp47/JayE